MARSKWKFSFFTNFIWRKIILFKIKKTLARKNFVFYSRSSTIPKCFINKFFRIHKGRIFRRLRVNISKVGYKFGEFSFTRKPFYFPLKKKLKKKNNFYRI